MSTLKTTNLQHASAASPAIVLASDGSATAQLSSLNGGALSGARNRIINGDMRIDQRNAGASVTGNGSFPTDRWSLGISGAGVISAQRSTVAPTGFTNSLSATVSTADASLSGTDIYALYQRIEGFNTSDFSFGNANARSFTLSFWVRSSVTGTYAVRFANGAYNRSYVTTYSISAANTWEYKTITLTADTTGTWVTDNGIGLAIEFCLGIGSTYQAATTNSWLAGNFAAPSTQAAWISSAGATFYITGVQLETGSVATPFERRSYGQELSLCQRYYWRRQDASFNAPFVMTQNYSSTDARGLVTYSQMRAAPTFGFSAAGTFYVQSFSAQPTPSVIASNSVTDQFAYILVTASGLTGGQSSTLIRQTGTAFIEASAEL
jgi:hypothetical protein